MPKGLKGKSEDNRSILEYALSHLEREAQEIQSRIDLVKRQLGVSQKAGPVTASAVPAAAEAAGGRKKRILSAAARARIAAAQKRRWAAHRKAKARTAKTAAAA